MRKLREVLKAMRIRSLRNRMIDLADVIDMEQKQKARCDKRIATCRREIEAVGHQIKALQPPRGATRVRAGYCDMETNAMLSGAASSRPLELKLDVTGGTDGR
jgi:hypothetical protein